MLLLNALTTDGSIQKLLFNTVKAQDTTGTTFTVNHLCILRELYIAFLHFRDGKSETSIVPMKHWEEKYNLPKYIVSRNSKMLSEEGVKDKMMQSGKREGKGFIKVVPLTNKNTKEGAVFDSRNKGIKLTRKGEKVCEILFSSITGEL